MFKLEAPKPGYQTTTVLPSPVWGDSKGAAPSLASIRAMDGTLYTYTKQRNGRKRLHFSFEIARSKALELRAFIKAYYLSAIRITDQNNSVWIAYLKNNPFEAAGKSRAASFPGGETMTVALEFEECE